MTLWNSLTNKNKRSNRLRCVQFIPDETDGVRCYNVVFFVYFAKNMAVLELKISGGKVFLIAFILIDYRVIVCFILFI
ncbi:MAG: hypothetical protein H6Q17_900 [Bacteroidetes bacterium]|jgi:hypothetical protein|nr:hypothetical protein [Bacteroidota bacterium]